MINIILVPVRNKRLEGNVRENNSERLLNVFHFNRKVL